MHSQTSQSLREEDVRLADPRRGLHSPVQHPKSAQRTPTPSTSMATSVFETDQLPDTEQKSMMRLYLNKLLFVHDNRHLEECLLRHVPIGFQPPTDVDWPSGKAAETSYYPFFADYLNKTHEEARRAYSAPENTNRTQHSSMDSLFTKDFRWFPCVQQQTSGGSGIRLEPDLVSAILKNPAIIQSLGKTAKGPLISWEHAVSYVVVKGNWRKLIAHSAKYARRILAHQPHRVAVRCVMMNCRARVAAIAEFDRAGCYATRWYDLKTPVGVAQFSKLLAGMYCASTEASGYSRHLHCEATEGGMVFRALFKGTWYYVRRFLCYRDNLWGRCTRALLLQTEHFILDKDHYVPRDESVPLEDPKGKQDPVDQRPQDEEASSKKVSLPTTRSDCAMLITGE